jgi:hypothetical protein
MKKMVSKGEAAQAPKKAKSVARAPLLAPGIEGRLNGFVVGIRDNVDGRGSVKRAEGKVNPVIKVKRELGWAIWGNLDWDEIYRGKKNILPVLNKRYYVRLFNRQAIDNSLRALRSKKPQRGITLANTIKVSDFCALTADLSPAELSALLFGGKSLKRDGGSRTLYQAAVRIPGSAWDVEDGLFRALECIRPRKARAREELEAVLRTYCQMGWHLTSMPGKPTPTWEEIFKNKFRLAELTSRQRRKHFFGAPWKNTWSNLLKLRAAAPSKRLIQEGLSMELEMAWFMALAISRGWKPKETIGVLRGVRGDWPKELGNPSKAVAVPSDWKDSGAGERGFDPSISFPAYRGKEKKRR